PLPNPIDRTVKRTAQVIRDRSLWYWRYARAAPGQPILVAMHAAIMGMTGRLRPAQLVESGLPRKAAGRLTPDAIGSTGFANCPLRTSERPESDTSHRLDSARIFLAVGMPIRRTLSHAARAARSADKPNESVYPPVRILLGS